MPVTKVRSTHTFDAVFTGDDDWEDVIRDWMLAEGAPEDAVEGYMTQLRDGVKEAGLARPWLMNTPQGFSIVSPQDFVKYFEDVTATNVLQDIWVERKSHPERGYDAKHDDSQPTSHLLNQVLFRVGPLSNSQNVLPDAVKRYELVQVGSLIVAAIDKIDRAQDDGTFAV